MIHAPGAVVENSGVITAKGRGASVRVDDALYQGVMEGKDDAIRGLEAANQPMVIRWDEPSHTGEELKLFREEMAGARERWKTLRGEWKGRKGQ